MMFTRDLSLKLKKIEDQSIYPIAKYIYLIRNEKANTHNRIVKLMEFIPKYFSYILLAELRQKHFLTDQERQLLKESLSLIESNPSLGNWIELLRTMLESHSNKLSSEKDSGMEYSTQLVNDLWEDRKGFDDIVEKRKELFELIKIVKPRYQVRKLGSSSIRFYDVIEMIGTYRNKFSGHGELANSHEYNHHNELLLTIVIEMISNIQLLQNTRVAFVEQAKIKAGKVSHEIYYSAGRYIDYESCVYEDNHVVDPEQIYLCDYIETEEYGPQIIPKLSLDPFIIYYKDKKENHRRNLHFIDQLNERYVSYTSYPNNNLYEPKNPKKIHKAVLTPNNSKKYLINRHQLSEGETIRESQFALPIDEWNNDDRSYEIIEPKDNPQIWENFEDVYYAYNAPFLLEKNTNLDLLVSKHAVRYKNPKLKKTKYLFFLGDQEDPKDKETFENRLNNFMLFMTKLYQQVPDSLETKLEIYFVNKELPNITFFAGKKSDTDYGILYIHNHNFMLGDMPKVAFLLRDQQIIESLKDTFNQDVKENIVATYTIREFVQHENIKAQIIKDLSSTIKIRTRLTNIPEQNSFALQEVIERKQQQGQTIYHFDKESSPFNHYTNINYSNTECNLYLDKLILNNYSERLSIDTDEYDIVIGEDSKELLFNIQLAVEGDLILPTPSSSEYLSQAAIITDKVVKVPYKVNGSANLFSELEALVKEAKDRGQNPTKLILCGANYNYIFTDNIQEMKELANYCKKNGVLVILDETLERTKVIEGDHLVDYYPEGTVIISEVCSHFSIEGYSLGHALIPAALNSLEATVTTMGPESMIRVPKVTRELASLYFEGNHELHHYLDEIEAVYRMMYQYVDQQLIEIKNIGYRTLFSYHSIYLDFENYRDVLQRKLGIRTSEELASNILLETNVSVIPCVIFNEPSESLKIGLFLLDFNGTDALKVLRENQTISCEEFMDTYCSSIKKGLDLLTNFIMKLEA